MSTLSRIDALITQLRNHLTQLLQHRFPSISNGVAAKFDKIPSSFRFDKITSPAFASCGSISQSGFFGSLIGANQTVGYVRLADSIARAARIADTWISTFVRWWPVCAP